jgi:hypothetical protein
LEAALDYVFADLSDSADPGGSIHIAASLSTHSLDDLIAKFEFVLRPNERLVNALAAGTRSHRLPKKEHDSLRMTLATHLVEMNGGLLRISKSEIHERTIEIWLPVRFSQP